MIPIPDPLIATILIFAFVFVLFALGLPIAFSMLGLAVIFALVFFPQNQWYSIVASMYGVTKLQTLMAIPLFILMGSLLAYTGMAADLYTAIFKWAGPLRGSLAMGTEVIGALFGAMCGDAGATTLSMGKLAMPEMLKRGYDKHLVVGAVATGGLLGILIPPTIEGILYSAVTGVSVGQLYYALFLPGFLLAALYIIYIAIRCYIKPSYGPAIPIEERATFKEKIIALRAIILPLIIILCVLGGIYSGVITPTEAAGAGSFLVIVAAFLRKGMNMMRLREAVLAAFKLSSMVIWLIMGITAFSNVYHASGASDIIKSAALLVSQNVGGLAVIIMMMVLIFLFGMIMDDAAVIMVVGPIFAPIVVHLGFDPIWFGVLFMINMQCAWLTPPYGFNLFLIRAVAPPSISASDIVRSVWPFICIQIVCLVLVLFIPNIALWLPSVMFKS